MNPSGNLFSLDFCIRSIICLLEGRGLKIFLVDSHLSFEGQPRQLTGSGAKRKDETPASDASRKFQDLEINFGKQLLVYFMRPPSNFELLDVQRPLES